MILWEGPQILSNGVPTFVNLALTRIVLLLNSTQ